MISSIGMAKADYYAGGSLSYGNLSNTKDDAGNSVSWDSALMLSGHIGQRIDFMRAEIELGITSWEGKANATGLKEEADLAPLMVNFYLDFPLNHDVEVFAGVGAGFAFVMDAIQSGNGVDTDALIWALQAKIGVSYNLSRNLALFTAFRVHALDDIDVKDGGDIETPGYSAFEIGARYSF